MNTEGVDPAPDKSDSRLRLVELTISVLLRSGVFASLALVIFGTVLSFLHHPSYLHSTADLVLLASPHAAFPHTPQQIMQDLQVWRGQAFVAVGLILLIATPIMRVAVSILAFIYQRDRVFVLVTTIVLAFLLLSFVIGNVK